jgi:hypothetical protein
MFIEEENKKLLVIMTDNRIDEGLLREFVSKGLSGAAIQEIETAINKRQNQIQILRLLKDEFVNRCTIENNCIQEEKGTIVEHSKGTFPFTGRETAKSRD